MKVPFFKTTIVGQEQEYVSDVLSRNNSFFDKHYTQKCEEWVAENFNIPHFFLTKSCTHSLELAALILDLKHGDEVIMPSFAFVSCANAFALRGATCVFVDIRHDTMNIDESKIEEAITPNTKAILTLNYGGVSCDYRTIKEIAKKHNLFIIEDNAHGTGARYGDTFLGSFGHISTFSFDHLKSINCGQGGGIAINDPSLLERFYVHYEFGTNRRSFLKGEKDRYEWQNLGSNYPVSELNAAMLYTQLQHCDQVNTSFLRVWSIYHKELAPIAATGQISIPEIDPACVHCGYNFYIKTRDGNERNKLMKFLSDKGINTQFHYTPLHSSVFGQSAGKLSGEDIHTSIESQKLLRLPVYYGMEDEQIEYVINAIVDFF